MPLARFIRGPGRTDIAPGEILSGVWIRKEPRFGIHHFEKVGQRNALAIAVVSMAAVLHLSGSGRIERAGLAWGSVGPTVLRFREVEEALVGRPLSRKTLEEVMPLVRRSVRPIDDVRAGAEYRRRVAGSLLLRLLDRPASGDRSFSLRGITP
ncbi:MAG: xanthine dehydrogenase family protein subunit M, partial [Deltaproteobacteria bacterium]|nr:xanthine dehydrogenase family protein subunit M [Deltaproteobacteria bacterium]